MENEVIDQGVYVVGRFIEESVRDYEKDGKKGQVKELLVVANGEAIAISHKEQEPLSKGMTPGQMVSLRVRMFANLGRLRYRYAGALRRV